MQHTKKFWVRRIVLCKTKKYQLKFCFAFWISNFFYVLVGTQSLYKEGWVYKVRKERQGLAQIVCLIFSPNCNSITFSNVRQIYGTIQCTKTGFALYLVHLLLQIYVVSNQHLNWFGHISGSFFTGFDYNTQDRKEAVIPDKDNSTLGWERKPVKLHYCKK